MECVYTPVCIDTHTDHCSLCLVMKCCSYSLVACFMNLFVPKNILIYASKQNLELGFPLILIHISNEVDGRHEASLLQPPIV